VTFTVKYINYICKISHPRNIDLLANVFRYNLLHVLGQMRF